VQIKLGHNLIIYMSAAIRDAEPPFGPDAGPYPGPSDIIIRSSDQVDFHVYKTLLSFSSPFFSNLFSFPPPTLASSGSNEVKDGKPVVCLPEGSDALEKLLVLCQPLSSKCYSFNNLDGVAQAHEAAHKYLVPGGTEAIAACLIEPKFLTAQPHRVFAIACYRRLPDVAKAAALAALSMDVVPPDGIEELALISGRHLAALQRFWTQCSAYARRIIQRYYDAVDARELLIDDPNQTHVAGYSCVWWNTDGHSEQCGGPQFETFRNLAEEQAGDGPDVWPSKWLQQHMSAASDAVAARPLDSVALQAICGSMESLHVIAQCTLCASRAPADLMMVAHTVSRQISQGNTRVREC
jgi:hypothetical protein